MNIILFFFGLSFMKLCWFRDRDVIVRSGSWCRFISAILPQPVIFWMRIQGRGYGSGSRSILWRQVTRVTDLLWTGSAILYLCQLNTRYAEGDDLSINTDLKYQISVW